MKGDPAAVSRAHTSHSAALKILRPPASKIRHPGPLKHRPALHNAAAGLALLPDKDDLFSLGQPGHHPPAQLRQRKAFKRAPARRPHTFQARPHATTPRAPPCLPLEAGAAATAAARQKRRPESTPPRREKSPPSGDTAPAPSAPAAALRSRLLICKLLGLDGTWGPETPGTRMGVAARHAGMCTTMTDSRSSVETFRPLPICTEKSRPVMDLSCLAISRAAAAFEGE